MMMKPTVYGPGKADCVAMYPFSPAAVDLAGHRGKRREARHKPFVGPLRVSIRTRRTDPDTEITGEDNCPSFDLSNESRPHTTPTNIRKRLEMMCGGSMSIQSHSSAGTTVKILIPPAQVPSKQKFITKWILAKQL